jgi:aspartate beta-hydroxylase/beta-hydroxylase
MASASRSRSALIFTYKATVRPLLLRLFGFLNRKCETHAGGIDRPVFYNVSKTYPSLQILEQNFDVIRKELSAILPQLEGMPRYHDIDHHQNEISGESEQNWRVFMLDVVGQAPSAATRACPRTIDLLQKIPYVNQAFFSILDAGKCIPAHDGVYCGYLRYHLGMIVPSENPPQLRVKNEFYTWKEGEGVLFDDSWNHEVLNQSSSIRVVLLVDVLRPLPRLTHLLNLAWTRGVGYFYANNVISKLNDFGMSR